MNIILAGEVALQLLSTLTYFDNWYLRDNKCDMYNIYWSSCLTAIVLHENKLLIVSRRGVAIGEEVHLYMSDPNYVYGMCG